MELAKELEGDESELYCVSIIIYAESLYDSGKEYFSEVELVESILERTFLKLGRIHVTKLKKLRKLIEGKDTTEEDY